MTGCGGCGGSASAAEGRRCFRHRKNASRPMIAMAKNAAMPIPASAPVDRPDEAATGVTDGGDAGVLGVEGGNVNGVGPGVMDGVVDGVDADAVVDVREREVLGGAVLMLPTSPVPVAVAVKDVIPVV